jgi:hypothetical protein
MEVRVKSDGVTDAVIDGATGRVTGGVMGEAIDEAVDVVIGEVPGGVSVDAAALTEELMRGRLVVMPSRDVSPLTNAVLSDVIEVVALDDSVMIGTVAFGVPAVIVVASGVWGVISDVSLGAVAVTEVDGIESSPVASLVAPTLTEDVASEATTPFVVLKEITSPEGVTVTDVVSFDVAKAVRLNTPPVDCVVILDPSPVINETGAPVETLVVTEVVSFNI